jgi:aspartyl-tRNA(Asn)/glutamyl-tRNA(Gln) amidotransferase subunit C
MSLTPSDVKRLAMLSRLALDPAEQANTLDRLNRVFGLIEQLKAIDTQGVEPMTHAQGMVLRLREDKVTETDQRESIQINAPAVQDGLYLVPKVIE